MTAESCWNIVKSKLAGTGRILDDNVRQRFEKEYTELQVDLNTQGKDLESIDPITNESYLDTFLARINKAVNEKLHDDALGLVDSEQKTLKWLDDVVKDVETLKQVYPKQSENELYRNVVVGKIFNTNYTYGKQPLELLMRNESQIIDGNFRRDVQDILGGEDTNALFKYMDNQENSDNFIREYINQIDNFDTNRVKPAVTGDTVARDIARSFIFHSSHVPGTKMTLAMLKPFRVTRNRIQVRWEKSKVEKFTEQEFVDAVAPRISKQIGDVNSRRDLARDIHQLIVKEGKGWRDVDDLVKNYFPDNQGQARLKFNNGDDLLFLSREFSYDQNALQMMLGQITETGRTVALAKTFGDNPKSAFNLIEQAIRTKSGDKHGLITRAAINYMDQSINPHIVESAGKLARTLSSVRAVEAGARLGSAVITSIMDVATILWSGRNVFNLPLGELLKTVFRVQNFTGNARNTRNYNLMVHDFSQAWLNNAGERFGLVDNFGNMSKWERGTSAYAKAIFKYSGLNWWTESLQKAVGGMYQGYMGRLIKSNTQWDDLTPQFRSQFEKFGIFKKDWDDLLQRQPLDSDGGLDIYALRESIDTPLSVEASIQSRLLSVVRDAVDTMVIKPSEFDKAAGRFFLDTDTGPAGGFLKLMTQFKTHPITYQRKVLARRFMRAQAVKNGEGEIVNALDEIDNIWPIVSLIGTFTMMGAVVTQLKEATAGRQIITDPGELVARSLTVSGVGGLAGDFAMMAATPFIRQMSQEKVVRTMNDDQVLRQIVGPVISDAITYMNNFSDTAVGGLVWAKDIDDGEMFKRTASRFSKEVGSLAPFQSLWYTRALYRMLMYDYMTEILDYRKHTRDQRRLTREAQETRLNGQPNNEVYNWMYKQIR
jgi:hypothetical protein